jgi:hypothetical protein
MKNAKTKLFSLRVALFGLVLILAPSCSDQDESVAAAKVTGPHSEKLSFAELVSRLDNKNLITFMNRDFKTRHSASIDARAEDELIEFEKIEKPDSYTTYLYLSNEYSPEKPYIEYFVIKDAGPGTAETAGFMKYIPAEGTTVASTKYIDPKEFTGKIQLLNLDESVNAESEFVEGVKKMMVVSTTNCRNIITVNIVNCSNGGNHPPGTPCTGGATNDGYYEIIVTTICSQQYNYVIAPDSSMGSTNSGGGGGDLSPEEKEYLHFINYMLNDEQQSVLAWHPEIRQFLRNNIMSEEVKWFIHNLTSEMIENPAFVFNAEASFNSPANIDLRNVKPDPNNPNEPNRARKEKFMCVYNKLTQSPAFKNLFLNMFDDNERLNLKLKIADLTGNQNGGRVGETKILAGDRYNNEITIDQDLLDNGSTIEIAKTMLHEFIHAFLNYKMADASIGMSIPGINNMDFQQAVNATYNGFNGDQDQHAFFYDYMLPTMQTVLSELRDLLLTPEQVANVNDLTLHIIQNTGGVLDTPWNWDDYFHNLSLNGLQNSATFINEIATIPSDGLPTNIVNQQAASAFQQYTSVSYANMPHACN